MIIFLHSNTVLTKPTANKMIMKIFDLKYYLSLKKVPSSVFKPLIYLFFLFCGVTTV